MAISVVAYFYHFFSEEVGTLSGQFLQSDLYDLRYLDCGGGTIWLYWGAQGGPNHINISCENMTFTSSYLSAGQLSPIELTQWGQCVHVKLLQLCPTLCSPTNCSPPGSSVLGIVRARILEWVAMPSSRGQSLPRDQSWVLLCLLHSQAGS